MWLIESSHFCKAIILITYCNTANQDTPMGSKTQNCIIYFLLSVHKLWSFYWEQKINNDFFAPRGECLPRHYRNECENFAEAIKNGLWTEMSHLWKNILFGSDKPLVHFGTLALAQQFKMWSRTRLIGVSFAFHWFCIFTFF